MIYLARVFLFFLVSEVIYSVGVEGIVLLEKPYCGYRELGEDMMHVLSGGSV